LKQLDLNIEPYQEGTQVPSIAWKVILRTPPPSGLDLEFLDRNVSEKLMNEPNITDATDYRENLTYINEIGIILNNEDGFFTNSSLTGILDTDEPIEVFLDGYFDVLGGSAYPIRKFGGWINRNRMKIDGVKKTCEAIAYSYFGKSELISGKVLGTRHFDSHGLILFNTGLRVTTAAVTGKFLKVGVHTVETRFDGVRQARLDDGEWTNVGNGTEVELPNEGDIERLKVYSDYLNFIAGQSSKIIVRNTGEQYPYILYYNGSLFEIVRNIYSELGFTDDYIQPYEIKTHDDRKVLSFYEIPDNSYSEVGSITSDNDNRLFIGIKNNLWLRDMTLQKYTLIYDGGVSPNTSITRLLIDEALNMIFVYLTDGGGTLDKIVKVNLSDNSSEVLFTNTGTYYCLGKIGNTFHYIKSLQVFIFTFLKLDNSTGIAELDLDGNITEILTDSEVAYDLFSLVYETDDELFFYYIKLVSNVPKLYRISYESGWGAQSYLIDFYISQTGQLFETRGTPFYYESKIFVRESPAGDSAIYNVTTNSFDTSFNTDEFQLLSPFEFENKLYVLIHKPAPFTNKIGYISNNAIVVLSDNLDLSVPTYIGGDLFRMCITRNYKGYNILNILSTQPNLLFRYSEWFNLCVRGEADFTEQTLRTVLTDLANTFLGYIKITADKKAYFVSRSEYENSGELTFKMLYNKTRTGERVYSEKYDRVEISNGTKQKSFGNEQLLDPKILRKNTKYIIDEFVIDLAKYFYDYYSVTRKIIKIKYPPTFYNYESLDIGNLTDYGLGTGLIHKVAPKKNECEFEILI
jgi:hypothetical protein